MAMEDTSILGRIGALVSEEKDLRNRHLGDALERPELERLDEVEVELDQCWDLLNQRRALREFDQDPNQASVRDQDTVEGYEQ